MRPTSPWELREGQGLQFVLIKVDNMRTGLRFIHQKSADRREVSNPLQMAHFNELTELTASKPRIHFRNMDTLENGECNDGSDDRCPWSSVPTSISMSLPVPKSLPTTLHLVTNASQSSVVKM